MALGRVRRLSGGAAALGRAQQFKRVRQLLKRRGERGVCAAAGEAGVFQTARFAWQTDIRRKNCAEFAARQWGKERIEDA